ncbi:hypothetical protein F4818DRAFT_170439 [Hypoxylon cercidicola]|nr:hypothetical protein F4818DRAFT_170439 [Hypoxylon cercidicola]
MGWGMGMPRKSIFSFPALLYPMIDAGIRWYVQYCVRYGTRGISCICRECTEGSMATNKARGTKKGRTTKTLRGGCMPDFR